MDETLINISHISHHLKLKKTLQSVIHQKKNYKRVIIWISKQISNDEIFLQMLRDTNSKLDKSKRRLRIFGHNLRTAKPQPQVP